MKKLLFCLTILLAFSQGSCDLLGIGDDSPCGAKIDEQFHRTSGGTGYFTEATERFMLDGYYRPATDGDRSSIIFEKWVQHVCPEKHAKISCDISADIAADINVTAKSYWYLLFETPVDLKISSDGSKRYWKGDAEIGLKQVYGDAGEGEYTVQTTIDFPSQGSLEADSTYLFNHLINVKLDAVYYKVE